MSSATVAAALLAKNPAIAAAIDKIIAAPPSRLLPKRPLGKTGIELSIIGFGGIVVMNEQQDKADKIVAESVEAGINYFDVAPSYGNAEEILGPALKPPIATRSFWPARHTTAPPPRPNRHWTNRSKSSKPTISTCFNCMRLPMSKRMSKPRWPKMGR